MKLVYKSNGQEVKVGDTIKTNSGESVIVKYFAKPHKPASSGKITVQHTDGGQREYYVGVIGAEWIDREDRRCYDVD